MQLVSRSAAGRVAHQMSSLPSPEDSEDAAAEADWSRRRASVVLVNLAAVRAFSALQASV